jgi:hypothetical protein
LSVSSTAVAKANGLSTVLDVLTAPAKAFEMLRAVPMWGWAYAAAAILAMAGQFLGGPAVIHALQASWPAQIAANPKLAAMTPAQQQQALQFAVMSVRFVWVLMPVFVLIMAALETLIMLVFKAAGRGDASFKHLWAASMNTLVVGCGIYSIVTGLIAMIRGPLPYTTTMDAVKSVPSLAWFAPAAGAKVLAFLAAFNVVSIWGAVLLALAMIHVARVSRANAIACAVVTTVLAGAYFSFGAR